MKKIISGVVCIALLVVLLGCPEPGKIQETYTVTFDSQGGSAVEAASVTGGEKAARPADPVKEGYSFAGWYKEADCTNVWNFDEDTVSAAVTLYAKWTVNSYTVTFNTNGGSEVSSISADHGTKLTAPTAPTKTGYGFDGWYKEEALTTAWDFEKDTITAAITLYAKWKIGSFTISYELNGGTNAEANPANFTIETADITLAAPAKTGYTFAGWFEKEDLSGDAVTTITKGSSGDKKFYAKWTAVTYNIVYELNSGTNAAANPAAYTIEAAVTLVNPTRFAREFAGWYENADFNGSSVSSIPSGHTGNKTFYAKWTWKVYSEGDTGPSGGKIVYVRSISECDPNVPEDDDKAWKYIEASSTNSAAAYVWSNVTGTSAGCTSDWINPVPVYASTYPISTTAPSTMISGLENTNKIVAQAGHTSSAAKFCLDYSIIHDGITYDDWYLPSAQEFYYLAEFALTDGEALWTSSELTANHVLYLSPQGFFPPPGSYDGRISHTAATKNATYKVRAVRRF